MIARLDDEMEVATLEEVKSAVEEKQRALERAQTLIRSNTISQANLANAWRETVEEINSPTLDTRFMEFAGFEFSASDEDWADLNNDEREELAELAWNTIGQRLYLDTLAEAMRDARIWITPFEAPGIELDQIEQNVDIGGLTPSDLEANQDEE